MTVEIKNLSKYFIPNKEVLSDINLTMPLGQITTILGPSGSGKTTLLRIIAGLEGPNSGEIHVGGRDVTCLPPQEREIGFVFQNYALFKHMNVYENIAFGLRIKKWTGSQIRDRVLELLALVGLDGLETRMISKLSGGQQQRVALARALAPKPCLLLLDEPFAAVDEQLRQELRAWIRRLHQQVPVTSVLVTHDQQDALELGDRVVLLNQGRVEQSGSPREVFERPVSGFVASFTGGVNCYRVRAEDGCIRLGDLALEVDFNGEAEVAIRPGDIRVEPCRDGKANARVLQSIFMGDFYKSELALDDQTYMTAHVSREQGEMLGAGNQVWIKIVDKRCFPI